jgi:hypothetical protein
MDSSHWFLLGYQTLFPLGALAFAVRAGLLEFRRMHKHSILGKKVAVGPDIFYSSGRVVENEWPCESAQAP